MILARHKGIVPIRSTNSSEGEKDQSIFQRGRPSTIIKDEAMCYSLGAWYACLHGGMELADNLWLSNLPAAAMHSRGEHN